ncbi:MAG: TatD family hydrolase [Acidobacteria bacterium]|nr:TatD family hydrolase [Acidobacteriota bacterium]MCA1637389.1 TatD family hydrolase [Acidobacteriota bacterium]
MIFVDSHCHIDGEAFDADRDEVVQRAKDAGVKAMLTVGTGNPHNDEIKKAVEVAESYENVFASVGVHPHDAKFYDDKSETHLIDLVESSKKVIAWGEIGLDFYYDNSPREIQIEVFRRQIRMAKELNLPIIIHSRDADEETTEILTKECSDKNFRGGIMHCFGGSAEMAKGLMKIGFYVSFAGNVTFKKAENLREAAKIVPLDKLLIETDCPFLTPVPFRGKRNEPSFVVHTAEFLAEFYKIPLQNLANATTQNFLKFFNLSFNESGKVILNSRIN